MLICITVSGVCTLRPSTIHTHDKAKQNTSSSATASTTPSGAAVGPEAEDEAEDEHHDRRGGVAGGVGHEHPDEHRRAPDGQRAEPVEDRPSGVRVEGHAVYIVIITTVFTRIPGSRSCRYSLRRAGQRAAEQVGEQQHEHDREGRHVEQLHGHVLDLEHGPPGEGERRRPAADGVGGPVARRPPSEGGLGDGRLRRLRWAVTSCRCPPRSVSVCVSSAGWPVRARNTSSRLGWPRRTRRPRCRRRPARRAPVGVARCRRRWPRAPRDRTRGAPASPSARRAAARRRPAARVAQPHAQRARRRPTPSARCACPRR